MTVEESFRVRSEAAEAKLLLAINLERKINECFISAYSLQDDIAADVSSDDITLANVSRDEDIKRLVSYCVGCIMGRYSLDKPGLIYAHSGNQGFDSSQYKTFRADDDGIIPLLETDWGIRDDATNRFVEFINVCWPGDLTTDNTDLHFLTFV